jgi:hypothetical protein
MLARAKLRARDGKYPFSISIDDIRIPEYCPVLGIPLVTKTGKLEPGSPTLDKIVPDLGYVPGNVMVISWRANKIKSDASIGELTRLGRFYEQYAAN